MSFPRAIVHDVLTGLSEPEVILLLGARRTGKTTVARQVAETSGYPPEKVHVFDLEDPRNRELFRDAGLEAMRRVLWLEGVLEGRKGLLVFLGIQHLPDPSNLLKRLHDHFPWLTILATGPSSVDARRKFSDSLAGRQRTFLVEPLSFDEFLQFRGEDKLRKLRECFAAEGDPKGLGELVGTHAPDLSALMEEYLCYGSYPEVVLLPDKKARVAKLEAIVEAYVRKDVRDLARVENLDGFTRLLKYLAVHSGAELHPGFAAAAVGLSRVTVRKYLALLEQTFITRPLPPFFRRRDKEISRTHKVYFRDAGIRNLHLMNFDPLALRTDASVLFETYVCNRLLGGAPPGARLFFYRTMERTAIEFVREDQGALTLVKIRPGDQRTVPRALPEFRKKYRGQLDVRRSWVVTRSFFDFTRDVKFVPIFLL
ncbi:MAG: ATP-binding protein [Acidobacteria bacterium]|nr:ATP-binding protein [Acidobacteriota bacterium]